MKKTPQKKRSLYNLRPGQLYLRLEEISPRLSHRDHLLSVVCPFVLFDPPFLAFALSVPPLFPPTTQTDVKLSSLTCTNTAIRTRSKLSLRRQRSSELTLPCERKQSVWGDFALTFDLWLSSEDCPSTLAKRDCTRFCLFAWLSTR